MQVGDRCEGTTEVDNEICILFRFPQTMRKNFKQTHDEQCLIYRS